MTKSSILNRRGFLHALGLLTGAVLVAPAVLAVNSPKEEAEWYRVTRTESHWRADNDPLRSTTTIELPPGEPGKRLVITDLGSPNSLTIKVQGSCSETYDTGGSWIDLSEGSVAYCYCDEEGVWKAYKQGDK